MTSGLAPVAVAVVACCGIVWLLPRTAPARPH